MHIGSYDKWLNVFVGICKFVGICISSLLLPIGLNLFEGLGEAFQCSGLVCNEYVLIAQVPLHLVRFQRFLPRSASIEISSFTRLREIAQQSKEMK